MLTRTLEYLRTLQTDHVVLFQVIEARNMEGVRAASESTSKAPASASRGAVRRRDWDASARGRSDGFEGSAARCQYP
jgi:hypothetical protein